MKTIIRFFSYLLLLASCSSSFILRPNNVFSTRTKTSLFVIKVDSKFISQNSPQVLSVPSSSPTEHKKRENGEDTKEKDLVQMVSFYRFVPIDNPEEIRDAIFVALTTRKEEEEVVEGRESRPNQQILGTVYVAKEGINAQLAIPIETFNTTMKKFQEILPSIFEVNKPNCGNVVSSDTTSFKRLIVRTRNFILRDGLEEYDEMNNNNNNKEYDWDDAGIELTPEQWHQELSQSKLQSSSFETSSPPPLLIDCRNTYESDEGKFQNSTALETNIFSESWQKLDELMEKQEHKNKDQPVYIYCTGGVRCVKTGAYLKQKLNYTNVRRLEHGIIGYQRWFEDEKTDNNGREGEGSNLWVGENFLFDRRRLATNSTSPS